MVPAAGVGRRYGESLPKQYQELAGRSVLGWSLRAILAVPGIRGVVVAVDGHDECWRGVPECLDPLVCICVGGSSRADSVRAGLARLAQAGARADDRVLVHDAARPAISVGAIVRLLGESRGRDGGLLALPVGDTIKRAGERGDVEHTLPRDRLWTAQTPQCFPLGALREALESAHRAGFAVTDEASAMERLGARPRLVMGEATNLKLTHAGDRDFLAAILASRAGRGEAGSASGAPEVGG